MKGKHIDFYFREFRVGKYRLEGLAELLDKLRR